MLLSDCAYAQADLRLCWSHIPHFWESHVAAQMSMARIPSINDLYYIIEHWTRQIDVCSYFESLCALCIVCIPVKAQICFDEWKYFKNWHVVMEAAIRDGFIPYPTGAIITVLYKGVRHKENAFVAKIFVFYVLGSTGARASPASLSRLCP